jgi:prevent-host-death family protein
MRKVGIKQLKNELSAYVRAAEAGEIVLVTDRGKVVAELVPPSTAPYSHAARPPGVAKKLAEPGSLEERDIIDRLIREGRMTPGSGRFPGPPPVIGHVPFDELMKQLDEDRADRW